MTYSLKAVLDKSPIQVAGAIVAVLNMLVILGAVHLTGVQTAAVNTGTVPLLALFVASKTANKSVLNDLAAPPAEPDAPPAP